VATGGRDTGVGVRWPRQLRADLDTGKLGLWPGGFLKVKAFTGYGNTENHDSGGVVPVNMLGLLPDPTTRPRRRS
jgi:porin